MLNQPNSDGSSEAESAEIINDYRSGSRYLLDYACCNLIDSDYRPTYFDSRKPRKGKNAPVTENRGHVQIIREPFLPELVEPTLKNPPFIECVTESATNVWRTKQIDLEVRARQLEKSMTEPRVPVAATTAPQISDNPQAPSRPRNRGPSTNLNVITNPGLLRVKLCDVPARLTESNMEQAIADAPIEAEDITTIRDDVFTGLFEKSPDNPTTFIRKTVELIFTVGETYGRNVTGTRNKKALDQTKMTFLKDRLSRHYRRIYSQEALTKIAVTAVDQYLRNVYTHKLCRQFDISPLF